MPMNRLPALAALLFSLCPSFAQEPQAATAAAKATVVVRSMSPAHRHVGASHTRYAVPVVAVAAASAKQASVTRRVPSLRAMQIRR